MKIPLYLALLIVGLINTSCGWTLTAVCRAPSSPHEATIREDTQKQDGFTSHELRLDKRAVRPKCSVRGYMEAIPLVETPVEEDSDSDAALERRIHGEDLGANITVPVRELLSRQMTLPRKNRLAFYHREFGKDNYQPVVWDIPNTQSDFNTAVFEEIGGGSQAKSLGVEGLCGCTVLIIASRSGVYMAHYFESLAFAPDDVWIDHYGSEDACFESTVTQGLKNGIPGRGRTKKAQQASLTENAAKLRAGGGLGAYLIGPSLSHDGKAETYIPKFNRIKEVVGEIVPELKTPGSWTDIRCDALDGADKALSKTPAGKLLFKYDPDHGKKGAKKKKKAALWVENSADIHQDEWN